MRIWSLHSFLPEVQKGLKCPARRGYDYRYHVEQHAFYAWDPLAALILVHPGIATFRDIRIGISMTPPYEGQTFDREGKAPIARVAIDTDPMAFQRLFLAAFSTKVPPKRQR
jgi:inosine-uridine nucleoside N-ribohydrolase